MSRIQKQLLFRSPCFPCFETFNVRCCVPTSRSGIDQLHNYNNLQNPHVTFLDFYSTILLYEATVKAAVAFYTVSRSPCSHNAWSADLPLDWPLGWTSCPHYQCPYLTVAALSLHRVHRHGRLPGRLPLQLVELGRVCQLPPAALLAAGPLYSLTSVYKVRALLCMRGWL